MTKLEKLACCLDHAITNMGGLSFEMDQAADLAATMPNSELTDEVANVKAAAEEFNKRLTRLSLAADHLARKESKQ